MNITHCPFCKTEITIYSGWCTQCNVPGVPPFFAYYDEINKAQAYIRFSGGILFIEVDYNRNTTQLVYAQSPGEPNYDTYKQISVLPFALLPEDFSEDSGKLKAMIAFS